MPGVIQNRRIVFPSQVQGGAAFNPSSLNLVLDLRTPNSALTTSTERTNGLIIPSFPGAGIVANPDIAAILDQSAELALNAAQYTSNFSAGADGFTGIAGTATGNQDAIGGEDDWLEVAGNSAVNVHYARKTSAVTTNNVHYGTVSVYIDAGNSVVDGIAIGNLSAGYVKIESITKGSVQTFPFYHYSRSADLDIILLSGANLAFDDSGESLYVKAISFSEVQGNHYIQDTVAKMGHWNNTTFNIEIDGVDDSYHDYAGFFTAVSSDSVGEFIHVGFDSGGAGVNFQPFSSDNGTSTHLFYPRYTAANTILMRWKNSTSDNTTFSAVTRDARYTCFFSSDNSDYYVEVDGAENAYASGTNHGNWFADNANLTLMCIGVSSGSIFTAHNFHSLSYRSTQFTAQERLDYKTWLDSNV